MRRRKIAPLHHRIGQMPPSESGNKTNKTSRERRHHGKRHLRRPQGSGLREFHRSARGRHRAVGFRRRRDQDRAAGRRRSLSQPAEPAGLSRTASTITRGCWKPATSAASRSISPSRKARRCCIASSPRPTSSSPIFRRRCASGSGSTYDELAPLNERLIYASFTGYGEKGEEANKPGFDSNAYWARSGLMDLVRADDDTTPARSVAGMGDHPCAMALYGAIVTALYKRERTGKGSHVSSNLMANGVWAARVLAQAKLCGAKFERAAAARARAERRHQPLPVPGRPLDHPVAAQRGAAMAGAGALHRPRGSRHRSALRHQAGPPCALARADQDFRRDICHQGPRRMAQDPRRQRPGVRRGRHPRRHSERPADDRQRRAGAVRERHHADHQQPDLGRRQPRRCQPRSPPGIGEHSDEILREAGYDEAAIRQLRASGAVA